MRWPVPRQHNICQDRSATPLSPTAPQTAKKPPLCSIGFATGGIVPRGTIQLHKCIHPQRTIPQSHSVTSPLYTREPYISRTTNSCSGHPTKPCPLLRYDDPYAKADAYICASASLFTCPYAIYPRSGGRTAGATSPCLITPFGENPAFWGSAAQRKSAPESPPP